MEQLGKIVSRAAGGGRKSNDSLSGIGDPTLTRINPPDELRDVNAITIWKVQCKKLIEAGMMAVEFIPLLLSYCNAYSLMIQADKMIGDDGITAETADGGFKKHPAINVRNDSIAQIARLGSLLGLDPLSRSRMVGVSGSSEEENEFDDF